MHSVVACDNALDCPHEVTAAQIASKRLTYSRGARVRLSAIATAGLALTAGRARSIGLFSGRRAKRTAPVKAFEQRNLLKYGDPRGPSVDQLRAAGISWEH